MDGMTSDFYIPGGKEIDQGKPEPPRCVPPLRCLGSWHWLRRARSAAQLPQGGGRCPCQLQWSRAARPRQGRWLGAGQRQRRSRLQLGGFQGEAAGADLQAVWNGCAPYVPQGPRHRAPSLSGASCRVADPPNYLSEARSQGSTEAPLPVLWDSGVRTGFGGHMPGAKFVVGGSVYNLEKATKGHFSTKGLAKQAGA
jgi:hypothetical protein